MQTPEQTRTEMPSPTQNKADDQRRGSTEEQTFQLPSKNPEWECGQRWSHPTPDKFIQVDGEAGQYLSNQTEEDKNKTEMKDAKYKPCHAETIVESPQRLAATPPYMDSEQMGPTAESQILSRDDTPESVVVATAAEIDTVTNEDRGAGEQSIHNRILFSSSHLSSSLSPSVQEPSNSITSIRDNHEETNLNSKTSNEDKTSTCNISPCNSANSQKPMPRPVSPLSTRSTSVSISGAENESSNTPVAVSTDCSPKTGRFHSASRHLSSASLLAQATLGAAVAAVGKRGSSSNSHYERSWQDEVDDGNGDVPTSKREDGQDNRHLKRISLPIEQARLSTEEGQWHTQSTVLGGELPWYGGGSRSGSSTPDITTKLPHEQQQRPHSRNEGHIPAIDLIEPGLNPHHPPPPRIQIPCHPKTDSTSFWQSESEQSSAPSLVGTIKHRPFHETQSPSEEYSPFQFPDISDGGVVEAAHALSNEYRDASRFTVYSSRQRQPSQQHPQQQWNSQGSNGYVPERSYHPLRLYPQGPPMNTRHPRIPPNGLRRPPRLREPQQYYNRLQEPPPGRYSPGSFPPGGNPPRSRPPEQGYAQRTHQYPPNGNGWARPNWQGSYPRHPSGPPPGPRSQARNGPNRGPGPSPLHTYTTGPSSLNPTEPVNTQERTDPSNSTSPQNKGISLSDKNWALSKGTNTTPRNNDSDSIAEDPPSQWETNPDLYSGAGWGDSGDWVESVYDGNDWVVIPHGGPTAPSSSHGPPPRVGMGRRFIGR
ncbi:hypothetical protein MKZ38_010171 [Zalerion maritima]|uniref:Uncharacterized protein n=1 Tax=Zalerion maritima TaxID=339359 RepID=A0AAD5RU83_9PEZI|nr:hypothetical protein MKZ38_010171 [Zalerion maritima]